MPVLQLIMRPTLDEWLLNFSLDVVLHDHIAYVIAELPDLVRDDIVNDPSFTIYDYEPGPGVVRHIPVGMPRNGAPARSVELKRTLRHRPAAFVRYVIAHELAHAHLRNRGRWEGDDPERAADALAAGWGFPKPA